MWWSTDETEINLSHIWVTSESDLNKTSKTDLDKIWVRSELSWDDEDWI